MWYIRQEPNPSGAYPAPQSNRFSGSAEMTDEQMQTLISYNGYVTLTIEEGVVTAVEPNTEAWEEWKASLPEETETEPEPTAQDDTDSMLVDHEYRITLLELGVTDI